MDRSFQILPQPDEITCGPTCLQAVYQFFGRSTPLPDLIAAIPQMAEGGTLAVMLANHALRQGFRATVFTYNLEVFDPTWFCSEKIDISERLRTQLQYKTHARFVAACHAYLEFLSLGGELKMQTLNASLMAQYLERKIPIVTGLSVTYLYQSHRERILDHAPDDIEGVPTGHFVVLSDIDLDRQIVMVADPYLPNPLSEDQHYEAPLDRVICAVLLGVLTYDANLLVLEPA